MRAYLITTTVIFGLVLAAHIWRVFAEHIGIGREPWFFALTAFVAVLFVWGVRLSTRSSRV